MYVIYKLLCALTPYVKNLLILRWRASVCKQCERPPSEPVAEGQHSMAVRTSVWHAATLARLASIDERVRDALVLCERRGVHILSC